MRRAVLALCLAIGVGVPAWSGGPGGDAPEDEAVVRGAGLPVDDAGLLAYFRRRAAGGETAGRVAELVGQLGSDSAGERARAAAALVAAGPAALPRLREAANDADGGPGAALARRCVRTLEADGGTVSAAAARLLAARRPAGAAAALLAFLPEAEDESVVEEVKAALAAVGFADGRPEPALLAALDDQSALRRAAAAEVLCRGGRAAAGADVRRLLDDPTPAVRLHAALALAGAHDPRGVAALVALLAEGPAGPAREAEEFLVTLAAERAPKVALGEEDAARRKARDAWAAWWKGADGPGLLDGLRKRTHGDADRDRAQALVARLGDDDYDRREEASAALQSLGGVAVRLLHEAERSPDAEVGHRARVCLEQIEKSGFTPLSPVDVRLIALRKPAGAAEALLGFLPFADDEGLEAEVREALDAVAAASGPPDPALLRALADRSPRRRGAAAEALCLSGEEGRAAARGLLADGDPDVRLRAALALAGAGERAAVPALAALAGGGDADRAEAAEEYLRRLAGDRLPRALAVPPAGVAARAGRGDAWAAWWRANAGTVSLVARTAPEVANRPRGYTLVVMQANNAVAELGADGKVRWQVNGLQGPMDAQVLPGDRVLVAELNANKVTERNRKGDVLWEKSVTGFPVGVQRLANGNTFIAARGQLAEVDRAGKEVYAIGRAAQDVMTARKLADGRIVCVTNQGACQTLDRSGKVLKSFPLTSGVAVFGNEVLPRGGVLTPVTWQNKVVEYDADGKTVWEAAVTQPLSATRLPGGNTLVALQQWPARLIELDRSGKQVGEVSVPGHASRVYRR